MGFLRVGRRTSPWEHRTVSKCVESSARPACAQWSMLIMLCIVSPRLALSAVPVNGENSNESPWMLRGTAQACTAGSNDKIGTGDTCECKADGAFGAGMF